jgi:protein O-mannosyl-transferase
MDLVLNPGFLRKKAAPFADGRGATVTDRGENDVDRHLCSVEDINVRQIAIVIRNGFQLNDFEMRRDLLTSLLLAALTLGVYWPVSTHGFIDYDDPGFVTENVQIQSGLSWQTIRYAFTQAVVGNWHPVTTLSHALDCQLFGLKPGAHHMVNAVLHSLNTAVLFLFLQLLFDRRSAENPATPRPVGILDDSFVWFSALVALLFGLHPLRVESVAWVAERKDLLSGFFFLLTLGFYTRYTTRKGGRRGWYLGALVCFALGLMSKPMVVTLPFVLLLLDFWPLQRLDLTSLKLQLPKTRALFLEKAPFFLLSAIDSWLTLRVQRSAGAMQVIQDVSWSDRLENAVSSYVRYLGKFFWPSDLAIVYPHPAKHYFLTDQWPGWQIMCAALLLVLMTALFLMQARRRPYLLFGWLWYLGTLVPVIGLVQVGEQAMADRYTYLPLIGPLISLAWWISEIATSAKWRAVVMNLTAGAGLALVVTLATLTRTQLGYWQDTTTLFEHALAVTADNPSAQFALGVGLEKQREFGKAMVRYRVATAIDPHYATAYYNMGQLFRKQGLWQHAVEAYTSAAKQSPKDLPTQLNLASALPHLGRTEEAIPHLERALEIDPNCVEALNNLAWLLSTSPDARIRNGSRAVQLAERGCALTGSKTPFLLGTLAAAYAEAGRYGDAVLAAEQACARATELGDISTTCRNRELLELYRASKPFHENPE